MAVFQHPLQLFSLEYPEGWEARYDEESGGLFLVDGGAELPTALSISPAAIATVDFDLAQQVVEAAARVEVSLPAAAVARITLGETEAASAEGARETPYGAARFRFWVLRQGALALYATQLGPGVGSIEQRETAEAVLRSVRVPEILPPTPAEFRDRVIEIFRKEYPDLCPVGQGPWGIQVKGADGQMLGAIGLENIYRTCLLNAESTGALIREHLEQVLGTLSTPPDFDSYQTVRARLLPMLKSEEWIASILGGADLATVEFAPGLRICFAIDEPTRVAYVRRDLLEQWDMPLERLQEVAYDNLARRDSALSVMALQGADGRPHALIVNTHDGYDATRIAIPGLRERFAEELGDEYFAGFPNRDFLVAFSARDPELAAGIVRQVRQDYHQMDHPITPTIYRVRAESIEPADEWSE